MILWLQATPPEVDNFSLNFDDSFPPPFFEATAEINNTHTINPTHLLTLHYPSYLSTTPYFFPTLLYYYSTLTMPTPSQRQAPPSL